MQEVIIYIYHTYILQINIHKYWCRCISNSIYVYIVFGYQAYSMLWKELVLSFHPLYTVFHWKYSYKGSVFSISIETLRMLEYAVQRCHNNNNNNTQE